MAQRDKLAHYHSKRDFSKTPEPKGAAAAGPGRRYLIQKHDATRLHYDFRLELDGVLKSWAVTRGPSLDPHEKRLAVEVEDHPLDYGSFEGIIPKGQYGGGTVMLWDEGTWEPIGDPHKGLKNGKLEFRLHGKRLTGEWTLVRMRDREKDKGRHNWLLIKRSDAAAHAGDDDQLLADNATSVASGRSMETIAAAPQRVWQSKAASGMPGFIPPQLATLAEESPQGAKWVHEVKFDGYRALAYLDHGNVRIFTRSGQDWTQKFRALAATLATFPVEAAILDGEIVALNEQGASSFKALQNALSEGHGAELQYYVFDLLYLNGEDLMTLPLLERKERLQELLKRAPGRGVFYSEHFAMNGADMLERLCSLQLEGMVSKRVDAAYSSGRGKSWLKTKCHQRQEFVIGGFTLPTHGERGVGALLLGYYEKDQLIYAGKVGTGFDNATSLRLRQRLESLARSDMPFTQVPADGKRGAHWVKPLLVCEVEFTEWTGDGRLRHPSFQGLREDKPATGIQKDKPVMPQSAPPPPVAKKPARKGKGANVAGITISHPDRVIYPGTDITKLQLGEYYAAVADHILPYVAGRPLSMIRCPEGIEECFFQRHIGQGKISDLYDTIVPVKDRSEHYIMIKDIRGLVSLVQWGVIELHPWGCLADKPDRPDRMIFDLDPAPDVPWSCVIEGAKEIRARMQELGLQSLVKTTGGKGLHVTVPLVRDYGWPAIKAFARAIAESMAHDDPKRYIAKASKTERTGRIFVDYLRNDLTSTAIAPFSARARKHAPVALPLGWKELTASLDPQAFTIKTVPQRLQKVSDPWRELQGLRQKIPAHYLRALQIEPK